MIMTRISYNINKPQEKLTPMCQNSNNKRRKLLQLPHPLKKRLGKMSVSNIFGNKIYTSKWERETNITNNIADIQANTTKGTTILEIKLSSTASIQTLTSDKTNTDLLKRPLLNTPKSQQIYHISPTMKKWSIYF